MNNDAVIYIRVSTDEQTEQSQLEPCQKLCNERGYTVIGVYADHGISAFKDVKRPSYNKVLDMVRNKKIQHIVVWALDRWTRRGEEELRNTITYLDAYGVQLHSVNEQWIESINIPGMGNLFKDFFIGLTGWLARQESEKISKRVKTSKKYNKALKKGKVGRPTIPDDVKQQIVDLLAQGKSYSYIQQNVTYKAKFGKLRHVSPVTINNVKKETNHYKMVKEKTSKEK